MEIEPITIDQDDAAEMQLALKNLEERRKAKRRKRIVTISVICAIAIAIIAVWLVMRAVNAQRQAEVPAIEVALPSSGSRSSGVQATGTLKPGSSAMATAEVVGVITDVGVSEGQYVNSGDVLFTVRSSETEKALADARTGVDRAQRNVDRAQSGVSEAKWAYDNAVSSYNASVDAYNASLEVAASAGQAAYDETYRRAVAAISSTAADAERERLENEARVLAQQAYDEAYQRAVEINPGSFDHSAYTAAIDSANDSVATARETLEDAQATYAQAQDRMSKCQVRAPRSGTVLSLHAVVGAEVGASASGSSSSSDGTAVIGDLSSFEVDVEVNEIDVSAVKAGQKAEVTFSAFPDLQEDAEVVSVAPAATSASGGDGGSASSGIVTFTVKLVIRHPDERLKAGMSAHAMILTEDAASASQGLSTPSAADASGASGASAEGAGSSSSSTSGAAGGSASSGSASGGAS